jgi:hypothetical protein
LRDRFRPCYGVEECWFVEVREMALARAKAEQPNLGFRF